MGFYIRLYNALNSDQIIYKPDAPSRIWAALKQAICTYAAARKQWAAI